MSRSGTTMGFFWPGSPDILKKVESLVVAIYSSKADLRLLTKTSPLMAGTSTRFFFPMRSFSS